MFIYPHTSHIQTMLLLGTAEAYSFHVYYVLTPSENDLMWCTSKNQT